jgi:transglutaminase-like putative cysteine protease
MAPHRSPAGSVFYPLFSIMNPQTLVPHDLTVRVGCNLVDETSSEVPLLLNLKPRRDPRQSLQEEKLVLGHNLPAEEFEDAHGNIVYRFMLQPGINEIRHDALVSVPSVPDNQELAGHTSLQPVSLVELPSSLLRYTLPSRYCDSDKLLQFAWEKFGALGPGVPQVDAISNWIHDNIEYRFGSGRPDISAYEVIQRGYGVCRDFAHTTVALCRALNLPARYVTGHLPDIGYIDPGSPMDFHAYCEVYMGGHWFTYDARYNVPRIGRVKVSCGLDAVDGAFSTIYGPAKLTSFEVWAYQVQPGTVSVGSPIDLSQRLDGTLEVRGAQTMWA